MMADETCGGTNPMVNMMKQFNQDRSHQRETFALSSPSGPSSMRTTAQRQIPLNNADMLLHEFFGQEQLQSGSKTSFHGTKLRSELQDYTSWASEFEHHKIQDLSLADKELMDQVYKQHQAPSVLWRDEFLFNNDKQLEEKFEYAFQNHFEWAEEFDFQQANWERQQQEDRDDFIAKQVELAATQTNFDHVWSNIQHELKDDLPTEKEHYVFEPDNPFLMHIAPIIEGLRLLDESLSDAVLAFEATVQHDPSSAGAWMQLGLAQAQNEKEEAAILALQTAVNLGHTDALIPLAISYTNESRNPYPLLEQWFSARYPQLITTNEVVVGQHDRVKEMFLRAAREKPQTIDPDVQIGLGVLFFKNEEYDKAIDCFASALKVRPDDCLMWNRMGAVLASQGRVEEAMEAYHKALEIRPSFVRGRYNLALGYMRMGRLKETAEHLLEALSLHGQMEANQSLQLLSTLRKTFFMMGRKDLVNQVFPGANITWLREELNK